MALSMEKCDEQCKICHQFNVVEYSYSPGNWLEDYKTQCAYCGAALGEGKAFVTPVVSKKIKVRRRHPS